MGDTFAIRRKKCVEDCEGRKKISYEGLCQAGMPRDNIGLEMLFEVIRRL